MAVDAVMNQNTALNAYATQQQTLNRTQRQQSPAAPTANSGQVGGTQNTARADQVTFSSEALRLSAASQPNQPVNQAQNAQNTNQYPPQGSSQQQAYQTAGAQSVTQAINTYHNTFKI